MQDSAIEPPADVVATVRGALQEDVGDGDVTASLVPAAVSARATVLCRERAVVAGRPWFDAVFRLLDPNTQIHWHVAEGDEVAADTLVCTLAGNARVLLTGERSALNFLQLLSGTASAARRYADAVAGTGCQVLDTRKTVPGLRSAQKYATAVGGVRNHRHGLFDGVLIKENHIMATGGIGAAIAAARLAGHGLPVEVEVESLAEAREALDAGADILMLDNFEVSQICAAVELNKTTRETPAALEVSGDVTLERLPELAATGVDYVSVGAITKHVRAVDLSMRFHLEAH
jgi:nicotinate-nucleotide pyrophosphorylase (carboxylating)